MSVRHSPGEVSDDLVALTRSLGRPERDLVIVAEGNTSQLLDGGRIAVKASGSAMADATAADFVIADLAPLIDLLGDDSATQQELTAALTAQNAPERHASIETLVHVAVQAVAPAAFVGHTHPTAVIGLLSSRNGPETYATPVYSDEAVMNGIPVQVPYATPGIALGRAVHQALAQRYADTGELPSLVLLGNHGIVAIAATAAGVDGVSAMAVKGARVRLAALAAGGVVGLPRESVETFLARDDIAERRTNLAR